jgi:hypothetical protein
VSQDQLLKYVGLDVYRQRIGLKGRIVKACLEIDKLKSLLGLCLDSRLQVKDSRGWAFPALDQGRYGEFA